MWTRSIFQIDVINRRPGAIQPFENANRCFATTFGYTASCRCFRAASKDVTPRGCYASFERSSRTSERNISIQFECIISHNCHKRSKTQKCSNDNISQTRKDHFTKVFLELTNCNWSNRPISRPRPATNVERHYLDRFYDRVLSCSVSSKPGTSLVTPFLEISLPPSLPRSRTFSSRFLRLIYVIQASSTMHNPRARIHAACQCARARTCAFAPVGRCANLYTTRFSLIFQRAFAINYTTATS